MNLNIKLNGFETQVLRDAWEAHQRGRVDSNTLMMLGEILLEKYNA